MRVVLVLEQGLAERVRAALLDADNTLVVETHRSVAESAAAWVDGHAGCTLVDAALGARGSTDDLNAVARRSTLMLVVGDDGGEAVPSWASGGLIEPAELSERQLRGVLRHAGVLGEIESSRAKVAAAAAVADAAGNAATVVRLNLELAQRLLGHASPDPAQLAELLEEAAESLSDMLDVALVLQEYARGEGPAPLWSESQGG